MLQRMYSFETDQEANRTETHTKEQKMTKQKDLIKILKAHGFYFCGGTKHEKYSNRKGISVAVPRHKELLPNTCEKILKEAGINKDELKGK